MIVSQVQFLDNEYSQNGFGRREFFQELEDKYRSGGVVVPLTYNDPGQGKNFVNGTVSLFLVPRYMRILKYALLEGVG